MTYFSVRTGQRVPELCPFYEIQIHVYPLILISCDKAGIDGILITISDNSWSMYNFTHQISTT